MQLIDPAPYFPPPSREVGAISQIGEILYFAGIKSTLLGRCPVRMFLFDTREVWPARVCFWLRLPSKQ